MASLNPKTGTLGKRLAAHLLRRTTFGPNRTEIDSYSALTADQAVDALLDAPGFAMPPAPLDPITGTTWVFDGAGGSGDYLRHTYMSGWWLDEAFDPKPPHIAQKLTFFLHTIFVVDQHSKRSENHYHTIALFRKFCNVSIKSIARKIIMDNSMIEYLDSGVSTKWDPNENFPRELIELFTIGKGPQIGPDNYTTYTEHDVQQAARIFTGIKQYNVWNDPNNQDPATGIPRGTIFLAHHEPGDKTFSSAFGGQTIVGQSTEAGIHGEFDQFIDMIFNQDATARNIVRKIYRFFVHAEITPEVETDIIIPLATQLKNNNYNLIVPIRVLLKSQHFYDEDDADATNEAVGGFIKSPLDLFVSLFRLFKLSPPLESVDANMHYKNFYRDTVLRFLLVEADMDLWSPPSVAGYNAYHQAPSYSQAWVSANTLPFRYKWADMLFTGKKIITWGDIFVTFNVMTFINDSNNISDPRDATLLVSEIIDYAFPEDLDPFRFNYFLNDLLLGNLSLTNWASEWDDYQLTGSDAAVKPQLEKLIRGIIQSPEFQLA